MSQIEKQTNPLLGCEIEKAVKDFKGKEQQQRSNIFVNLSRCPFAKDCSQRQIPFNQNKFATHLTTV